MELEVHTTGPHVEERDGANHIGINKTPSQRLTCDQSHKLKHELMHVYRAWLRDKD
jgi:hypothetical protein